MQKSKNESNVLSGDKMDVIILFLMKNKIYGRVYFVPVIEGSFYAGGTPRAQLLSIGEMLLFFGNDQLCSPRAAPATKSGTTFSIFFQYWVQLSRKFSILGATFSQIFIIGYNFLANFQYWVQLSRKKKNVFFSFCFPDLRDHFGNNRLSF